MFRRGVFAVSLLLVAAAAPAQVTIQHGNTLSQLINNLYGGGGIQLADTGHQAHFGETQDFQNFTATLQAALQSRSFLPVPSAVGLVSYRFNEATGTYERVEGSLGPILAERGSTTGKGNFNLSLTYTFANYETINGQDSLQLVLHHCLTPDCTFGNPNLPFLKDTINVDVHFRLKSQALALSAVYGLNNRLDVGLVLPYIRNDMQVFTHAFIVYAPGSGPQNHHFDPAVQTPDQLATGTAIGIGDVVARAKLRLSPKAALDSALLVDLTLPSGDKANFLGTGRTKLKATYIASRTIRRITPHINFGYEAQFGERKLNVFDYRAGVEIAATPRLTVDTDLIGVVRPHANDLFQSVALGDQHLLARSEIDGVLGGKWRLAPNRALVFNVLVPMNTAGIRPSYVITAGMQMTM